MRLAWIRSGIAGAVLSAVAAVGAAAQDGPARIAIAMFGPHPSLEQVSDGFKEQLAAEGIAATYDEGNVSFDRSLVPQLLNRMAAGRPDLMLTVTTPMTQSARQVLASRDFPIVFAPVTDPVQAGVVPSWEGGAPLIGGVSNLPDFAATLGFMKQLVPGITRLAILYNPGDDSDTAFVERLETAAAAAGITLENVGVDNVNDIPQRVRSLQGRVDALFVPASSMLQPAAPAISSAAMAIKVPVFGSNTPSVDEHQVTAALAVDFHRIGVQAGSLAARVLKGQDISALPVTLPGPEDHLMRISARQMEQLGLELPDSLKDCACVAE